MAINVWNVVDETDKLIEKYSIDWTIDRISLVDLSILRLAFYELIKTDTPYTIILNEAVELSKEFSEDDSPKFINGILGNYVKENVHGTDKKLSKVKHISDLENGLEIRFENPFDDLELGIVFRLMVFVQQLLILTILF